MTQYLRFTDEATFQTAAEAAGLYSPYVPAVPATDEEPEQPEQPAYYTCYTHDHSMDIVGVIYNNDGVYDEETGEVLTPPTPMPGWHVNFKGTLPDGWDANLVTPITPYRKFAGE
jgi:hypothetical protein